MKLLILTQKVDKNDPILGFFHRWVEEFSKHCEKVTVICLEQGEHALPTNVKVLSLGKEKGASKISRVLNFYKYIFAERKEYDTVFVHMNPEYIVLGGLLWKLWHKKIALWYVHRQVNLKLRVATFFADIIFTSSKESFGIDTPKVHYMGHGIDTESLIMSPVDFGKPLIGMHIGRITLIKHIDTIIRAVKALKLKSFRIVGAPATEADKVYKTQLEALVGELGLENVVTFDGSRPNYEALRDASFTVNAAPDGGMDKVVLESLAAGRPAFASNIAFGGTLGIRFMFKQNDPEDLAHKIDDFFAVPDKEQMIETLSKKVRDEYDVGKLIEKIISILS